MLSQPKAQGNVECYFLQIQGNSDVNTALQSQRLIPLSNRSFGFHRRVDIEADANSTVLLVHILIQIGDCSRYLLVYNHKR